MAIVLIPPLLKGGVVRTLYALIFDNDYFLLDCRSTLGEVVAWDSLGKEKSNFRLLQVL